MENNYVYLPDPINDFDLEGTLTLTRKRKIGIGIGLAVGATVGVCAVTAGIGCIAGIARGAAWAGRYTIIRRYTAHGLKQMLGGDGGRGVARSAVRYTLKHGKSLGSRVDAQRRWSWVYGSARAQVAVNSKGKIVTSWAKSKKYYHKRRRW